MISLFLSVVLAGVAITLALIGWLAAGRYSDSRLTLLSAAFLVIALVGVLSLLGDLSPAYGEPLRVEPVPLFLLVVALGLMYLSILRARIPPQRGHE